METLSKFTKSGVVESLSLGKMDATIIVINETV